MTITRAVLQGACLVLLASPAFAQDDVPAGSGAQVGDRCYQGDPLPRPGLVCLPAFVTIDGFLHEEWEYETSYILNARKGDAVLSAGCELIGNLLRQVYPPQTYSHAGIMVEDRHNQHHRAAVVARPLGRSGLTTKHQRQTGAGWHCQLPPCALRVTAGKRVTIRTVARRNGGTVGRARGAVGSLLCSCAIAFALLRAAVIAQPPVPAPNVVVLVIDDTRWDSIGAAGHRIVRTPRLDRLAADGIRFSQARVTTSICMVSRATLLTGQYMSRHGIDQFGKPLTPQAFAGTYPGLLRGAGYWTGYVGKYDVGAARPSDFDFVRTYQGRHWLEGAGGERVHVTEQNARDSLDFLRARPKDKPFLLSVGYFAAHAEDNAKEQYLPQDWSAAAYRGVKVPPSPLAGARFLHSLPPFLSADANEGRVRFKWRFDTPERYQDYMIRYYRLITEVDAAVGRLVDELKAQGVYDNTLIVFIGDNGYFHGDRGLADKWYPYEQALRVPLIVRDPRLRAGRRGMTSDRLALNIDIAPTIVAAAGMPAPPVMQGRDLSPLYLADRAPAWRDEFFYEHPTITSRDRIPSSQGVVRRDWKYVYWPEFEHEQLFDLRNDGVELTNLAGQPAHAKRQAAMRQQLDEWRRRAR